MTASGLASDSPPEGHDVGEAADGITVGSVIADYRLEEQIGHGGMAVVFRASDERLGRQVAVKILAPALGADRAFRRRFVRESRAAALVNDPHIIPIYQAGESGGLLFIAMRLVIGGDARTLLRHHGPLPPARAAALLSPVASALDAAHAAGLVHRDVKPANMLLDVRPGCPDHVYLSDFGLSKRILSSPGLTGEGIFVGTPHYVAPEQVNGSRVDGRADQYSLACAAYELLSGAPPFRGGNAMAVIHAHVFDQAPALTTVQPGLPLAVDPVLAKALAKAPAERYATCWDFAEALRAALGLPPYAGGPAATPGPRRSGPEAGSRTADPAGLDDARPEGPGTGVAAGRTAKRRAAGRHRKRGLRLAAAAIAVASLLAGASAAAVDLTGRHADGQKGRQPHASSAEPLAPVLGSRLESVAVSATSTFTVGGGCKQDCAHAQPEFPSLIAHWDGASWSKLASPVRDSRLVAAATGPAGITWLAGYACMAACGRTSEVDKTLLVQWDGRNLFGVSSLRPGRSARLAGVAAAPGGTAYAVGSYCQSGCGGEYEIDRTLLLSWGHGRWSRLHSASPGLRATLTGVSIGPAGEAWAVGYYCVMACDTLNEVDHVLILRPGAGGWSSASAPSPAYDSRLLGVSAGADGTAWAVGDDSVSHHLSRTLIMRWDNHRWQLVSSPDPGSDAALFGVSTGPGGTVLAVGSYCVPGCDPYLPDDRTLIVQSGARGWHVVPSPESGSSGRLLSVSAGPDGTVWAVGYSCVSGCGSRLETDRTLILQWQGTRWIAG